jgi:hypothetical protein
VPGFHPLPGEPQHPSDRRFEVVVTDLAERDAAQRPESMLVSFEEGILAARQEIRSNSVIRSAARRRRVRPTTSRGRTEASRMRA